MAEGEANARSALDRELFGGSDSELSDIVDFSEDEDGTIRKKERKEKKRRKRRTKTADSDSEVAKDSDDEEGPGPGDADYDALTLTKKRRRKRAASGDEAAVGEEGGEGGERKKKKKKKRRAENEEEAGKEPGGTVESEDDETTIRKKVDAEIKEALAAGKVRRQRKTRTADGEEDISRTGDDIAVKLREEMMRAAKKDKELNEQGQPALAKMKLLSGVKEQLSKHYLQDAFHDNGVVDAIREWLEPFADGSLPPLIVQLAMIESLEKLQLTTDIIRDSKVGRIVNFLATSAKTTAEVQKRCKELVGRWSKNMFATGPQNRVEVEQRHMDRHPSKPASSGPIYRPNQGAEASTNEFGEKMFLGALRPAVEAKVFRFAPKSEVGGDFGKRKAANSNADKEALRRLQSLTGKGSGGTRAYIGGVGDRATGK